MISIVMLRQIGDQVDAQKCLPDPFQASSLELTLTLPLTFGVNRP